MADLHKAFQRMSEDLERLVDDFFLGRPPFVSAPGGAFAPPTDIYETAEEIGVRVEIPGVDPRDVEVTLKGDCLVVRGERKCPGDAPGAGEIRGYHRKEIHFGPFLSLVRLPSAVDQKSVTAAYESGFLCVRLPKRSAAPESRAIPIQIRFGAKPEQSARE